MENTEKKFQSLDDLSRNKHLISELKTDENGEDFRMVDGKKIYQIKERTDEDRAKNEAINLWRMRNR